MATSIINVKDASGATVAVARLPDTGPVAKANALPFTIATDDPLLAVDTAMSAKLPAALGQTTKANSLSVGLASDDSLLTLVTAPTTGTQSNVASSATDVTILASNAARKGAYFYNDSTQVLYILFSNATSSSTVYTQKMAAGDAFNLLPGSYTGVVKGIWASANGSARVTEWS